MFRFCTLFDKKMVCVSYIKNLDESPKLNKTQNDSQSLHIDFIY